MIKGVLALFRSGVIFNPMVFLGILCGFIAMGTLEGEQLHALYTNHALYLLMLIVAGLYVFFFRRVYYRGGVETDWGQTLISIFGHFLRLVIAFIFSMLFIMVMSFGSEDESDYNIPEYERLEKELQNTQELRENYKAIMENYNVLEQK